MDLLKIALLQIAPCGMLNENLEKESNTAEKQKRQVRILRCSRKCGAVDMIFTKSPPMH